MWIEWPSLHTYVMALAWMELELEENKEVVKR
jgi:hypothetical protein